MKNFAFLSLLFLAAPAMAMDPKGYPENENDTDTKIYYLIEGDLRSQTVTRIQKRITALLQPKDTYTFRKNTAPNIEQ